MTRRLRCDFPCTLAIAALAIAATAAAQSSPALARAMVADGRIAHGELWRAATGPLVHATWAHLVRDLALAALAGAAYEAPLRSRRALLFAGGLVVPPLAVLAAGDVAWYCGLSGLSHALLAAALAFELVCRRGAARAVAAALCAIAAVKPIYELATGAPAFAMSLGAGVVQVPLAHAAGAVVGVVSGLRAGLDRYARICDTRRQRSPAPAAGVRTAGDPPRNRCKPGAAARWRLLFRRVWRTKGSGWSRHESSGSAAEYGSAEGAPHLAAAGGGRHGGHVGG